MQLVDHQGTLFDERFLGRHAGQIMSDPTTALVELVANAWDAYATVVQIFWPDRSSGTPFRIVDNGIGMTKPEFQLRWRTLDYNRLADQGSTVQPPADLKGALPRTVYGRNGRGRHAAFLFSEPYRVRTWTGGRETSFLISKGRENPIEVRIDGERNGIPGHGTEISGVHVVPSPLEPMAVRGLLGTRFLMDPSFEVYVDGIRVTFGDIPNDFITEIERDVEHIGKVVIRMIDSGRPDRTTKQHGLAWWVNRRLVGVPGWHAFEDKFIDGRTEEAKRYTFIILADFLTNSVESDWSGFKRGDDNWEATRNIVYSAITEALSGVYREKRAETRETVRKAHHRTVSALPRLSRDRWNGLLDQLIEKCPSLGQSEIDRVMGLLANLELAQSKYGLLAKLHELTPRELDSWNELLSQWTTITAKAALDEIADRLKLIEEIRTKTKDYDADEVRELQPLFGKALWIFGPQFESIEFTSNQGMTAVIKKLFKQDDRASRNRPDFVVLPSGSVGFYARPSFDSNLNEAGTEVLVIVELKKPGSHLGQTRKDKFGSM